jgi:TRAP transporter TAXI family solute receptor
MRDTKIGIAVALVACALATGGAQAQPQERRYTIGTNPPGTLYHIVGSGFAKVLQEKLGKQTTVQPGAGSSTYLPLIQNREVTMGIVSSLDGGGAYRGEQGRSPMPKLHAVARLWPLSYGFMARGNSGIKSIADLKGKRVVTDIKANAALAAANVAMLASAGLLPSDVTAVSIGDLPQGSQGVIDGTIDATTLALGIPLAKQAHASAPGGIVYLTLSGPNATSEFLNDKLPGLYTLKVSPSPAMPEVTELITVSGFDIFLIASEDVSDGDVTGIVKTLHDNWESLQRDFPALRSGRVEDFATPTNTVPYHPAAIAYFKSKNLWSEGNKKREESFKR